MTSIKTKHGLIAIGSHVLFNGDKLAWKVTAIEGDLLHVTAGRLHSMGEPERKLTMLARHVTEVVG